jgi:hypothetical protein
VSKIIIDVPHIPNTRAVGEVECGELWQALANVSHLNNRTLKKAAYRNNHY